MTENNKTLCGSAPAARPQDQSGCVATPSAATSARAIAAELRAGGMRCNCDLDNWEPERSTGHSWVCRIHTAAVERFHAISKDEGRS